MAHKPSLLRLENFLNKPCELLHRNMDALEFKVYLIAMLFLKGVNVCILKERSTSIVELSGYLKELGYE